MRRGFKAEAEDISREIRAELGLGALAPLDVWRVAQHLEIPLITLRPYEAFEPEAIRHFTSVESGAFSAMTLSDGSRRVIIYNDAHARTRQASDLAHEIAHALLQHRPHAALDDRGCRVWSAVYEEEADWLGGALLVPADAAVNIARLKTPLMTAASTYGVSPQMMQYRMNVTGAVRRAELMGARRRNRAGH